jgi:hypothetical protein
VHPSIDKLFENADVILFPSLFTITNFTRFFGHHDNFALIPHNDYRIDFTTKNIPQIIDKEVNIGVLHEYTICKGKEFIDVLSVSNEYRNYKINWKILGVNIEYYQEDNFFEYIQKHNIHCLTLLNKWGETWCYSLTKFINSGLPFIYNNLGSFKERIPKNFGHFFKVYDDEKEYENDVEYTKLKYQFHKMLDYIIENNGKFSKMNCDTTIRYNKFYDQLFDYK